MLKIKDNKIWFAWKLSLHYFNLYSVCAITIFRVLYELLATRPGFAQVFFFYIQQYI